jgi:Family of unknown function (DUF6152)
MNHPLRAAGGGFIVVVIALGLMAGVRSVAAHHSTTMFDYSRQLTVEGTVKELRWVNPHVSLLIFGTTQANDEPTDWLLETTSPSVLVRLGWSRTSLKPGDRVRVQINSLRDPEQHGGTVDTVTLIESGKTFGTNNREQERPDLE